MASESRARVRRACVAAARRRRLSGGRRARRAKASRRVCAGEPRVSRLTARPAGEAALEAVTRADKAAAPLRDSLAAKPLPPPLRGPWPTGGACGVRRVSCPVADAAAPRPRCPGCRLSESLHGVA